MIGECWQNLRKFYWKIGFLKKSQNFEFSKNRGKIKKNNFIFEIFVSKNINNDEQI